MKKVIIAGALIAVALVAGMALTGVAKSESFDPAIYNVWDMPHHRDVYLRQNFGSTFSDIHDEPESCDSFWSWLICVPEGNGDGAGAEAGDGDGDGETGGDYGGKH